MNMHPLPFLANAFRIGFAIVFYLISKIRLSLSILRVTASTFFVVSLIYLSAPEVFARQFEDAEINESISIGVQGNSVLLATATPVQVVEIDGDNAIVSLRLKDGSSVKAQVPTQYLNILPPKQDSVAGNRLSRPNSITPLSTGPSQAKSQPQVSSNDLINSPSRKTATFTIANIHVHEAVENINEGIMIEDPTSTLLKPKPKIFIPEVEVKVSVSEDAPSKNLTARIYYFDGSGKLLTSVTEPSMSVHNVADGVQANQQQYVWPTIVPKNERISLFFPLPPNLPSDRKIVAVFGNSKGLVAASTPDNEEQSLNYPDHDLVAKTLLSPDVDVSDPNEAAPLIEEAVKTDNPRYPVFTLLMHLPHGVKNPKDVSGVLATCIIANSVGQIRDRLNAIQPQGDPDPYFAYAESHNMAVIAWGARWVWDSYANFDEMDKAQVENWDRDFGVLADAWDRGVGLLVNRYSIPDHDYLLYGFCAGGEWAHRLALQKPDRFLAVQVHISTSYDAPTPEGGHVMWLVTTGELDNGCDRARRFYTSARKMGYPIIFKAVPGLGHGGSSIAEQLGVHFFDYALDVKHKRDAANAAVLVKNQPLDLSGFNTSPYFGDLMNQEMFVSQEKQMIPSGFLVPLPTKDIADAWNQ